MKRIIAIISAISLMLGICMPVFADNGGFVSSPSQNLAPTVEDVKVEGAPEGVEVIIDITAYASKNDLAPEEKKELESAYDEIKKNSDVTNMVPELKEIAQTMEVPAANLAVSDLFDISINVQEHGNATMSIRSDNLENFVALLHCKDGNWEIVENAKAEGNILTFTVDSFSPFAIVVDGGNPGSPDTPPTGDMAVIYIFAGILTLCAAAAICLFIKSRTVAK